MQNYKKYAIPSAQLIIADVPYNVGKNFYGSNPMWYNGGDNKNGESKLAGKDTGVMYLVYQRNGTGCTVMLNADGTPKIWQGEE